MCVCASESWKSSRDKMLDPAIAEPEAQKAEEKKPELTLSFSIPKGVSIEDAKVFAQGLLSQIAAWHTEHEPEEESVDLTKGQAS